MNVCSRFQRRHDRGAIGIDERNPDAFPSFFHTLKTQLHREGTLRVNYWCFSGVKAVEATEDIQLATGINSGCIAQSKDFNSHNSPQPHVQEFTAYFNAYAKSKYSPGH